MTLYQDPLNLPDWVRGPRVRDVLTRLGAVLDDVRLLHDAHPTGMAAQRTRRCRRRHRRRPTQRRAARSARRRRRTPPAPPPSDVLRVADAILSEATHDHRDDRHARSVALYVAGGLVELTRAYLGHDIDLTRDQLVDELAALTANVGAAANPSPATGKTRS